MQSAGLILGVPEGASLEPGTSPSVWFIVFVVLRTRDEGTQQLVHNSLLHTVAHTRTHTHTYRHTSLRRGSTSLDLLQLGGQLRSSSGRVQCTAGSEADLFQRAAFQNRQIRLRSTIIWPVVLSTLQYCRTFVQFYLFLELLK